MTLQTLPTLLRRSDTIATYGMLVAGVVHTSLTPIFKPTFDQDALWFAGTGLALCFLAGLNLLRRTTAHPSTRWFGRAANVVGTVYLLVVAQTLQAPHVYLVLAFVGAATINSFIRSTDRQPLPERV